LPLVQRKNGDVRGRAIGKRRRWGGGRFYWKGNNDNVLNNAKQVRGPGRLGAVKQQGRCTLLAAQSKNWGWVS